MVPTAKSLILQLLMASAGDGVTLTARRAIAAGTLFDIGENNVRVALARLTASGLVEMTARGEYGLGAAAADLAREVASWRTVEEQVRPWKGGYVAVHSAALGRADRSALLRRARALSLLGFAELDRGLHVRPDNLHGGAVTVRARLHALGLEPAALVFSAASFDAGLEARVRRLWDGKALTLSYKRARLELERWRARAPRLTPAVAARESFLLGGSAIRQIVYDPLLPSPLVDVEERRAFVDAMKEMDRDGHAIWRRFFDAGAPGKANERRARPRESAVQ